MRSNVGERPPKDDRRTVFGWAMYDWANSAYITAGMLIFSVYFADVVYPDEGLTVLGLTMDADGFWALIVGFGALVLFLVMPVLGAAADFSDSKLRLLRIFAYTGAAATVFLGLVGPAEVALGIVLVLLSRFGFVAANVMYEGFLPEIASDEAMDRISARGYALGYLGGGVHLALAAAFVAFHDSFGLSETAAGLAAVASAGVWWAAFGTFAFTRLRDGGMAEDLPSRYRDMSRPVAYAVIGFSRTWTTARHAARFRQLMLFIVAYVLYNDGVATVIAQTGVYASEVLELSLQGVILPAFLVTQFVAFPSAIYFGRLAGRRGTKFALLAAIAVWALVPVGGFFLPVGAALPFFLLAILAGLVLGGVQALSRSLYASMVPEEASAEFFGFYSVFSKFSAIWAPLFYFVLDTTTGSARIAILSITLFFVAGGLVLAKVDVDRGRSDRDRWRFRGDEAEVVGI